MDIFCTELSLVTKVVRLYSEAMLLNSMHIIVRLFHEKNICDFALGVEKNILKLA